MVRQFGDRAAEGGTTLLLEGVLQGANQQILYSKTVTRFVTDATKMKQQRFVDVWWLTSACSCVL
jgi:hypothetical protein